MKNIVDTIQKEQNEIIRDVAHKNLIVEGIAGSGKTSVALHRIAFLLYKINNLKGRNVILYKIFDVKQEEIVVGNGSAELIRELGKSLFGKLTLNIPVFNEYISCFDKKNIIKVSKS